MILSEFLKRVNVAGQDDCWEWTMSTINGYGQVNIRNVRWRAHRLSFELHKGPIGSGLMVRHTCDNRLCCNPAHLVLGTHEENMKDKKDRARGHGGKWKLTEDDVRAIRASELTKRELSETYGVSEMSIYQIRAGITWKHIK